MTTTMTKLMTMMTRWVVAMPASMSASSPPTLPRHCILRWLSEVCHSNIQSPFRHRHFHRHHHHCQDGHFEHTDAVMEIEAEPGDLMAGRPPDKYRHHHHRHHQCHHHHLQTSTVTIIITIIVTIITSRQIPLSSKI